MLFIGKIDRRVIEYVFILTEKITLTCRRLIAAIHSVCNSAIEIPLKIENDG